MIDLDNYREDAVYDEAWEGSGDGRVVVEATSGLITVTSIEDDEDPLHIYVNVHEVEILVTALREAREAILKDR